MPLPTPDQVFVPGPLSGDPAFPVRTKTIDGAEVESVSLLGLVEGVAFDRVELGYAGSSTDLSTATFKKTGSIVAIVTLTYDGSHRLVSVERTA